MRIGVELAVRTPVNELLDYIKDYDSYGFERIWIPDAAFSQWEVWTTAALAAVLYQRAAHRCRRYGSLSSKSRRHRARRRNT